MQNGVYRWHSVKHFTMRYDPKRFSHAKSELLIILRLWYMLRVGRYLVFSV